MSTRTLACLRRRLRGAADHSRPDDPHRHQLFDGARPARQRAAGAAVALGDSTALVVVAAGPGCAARHLGASGSRWSSGSAGCTCSTSASSCCAPASSAAPSCAAPRGARVALAAVRQHLPRDRAESQGHRVLRRLPAAVHRRGRRSRAAAVAAGHHLRRAGGAQRHACTRCSPRRRAALLGSPRAQRRFNLVGGSLLSGAGVWALLARRPV